MKARKQVVLLIRVLAFPAIIAGLLSLVDTFLPSRSDDEAVVNAKEVWHARGTTYNITAQGRLHYSESVSRGFYTAVTKGSILRITLTPIFSEWKKVEVMDGGQVVVTGRGQDLLWIPAVGLVLLFPVLSFRNAAIWYNFQYLIVIGVAEFGGLLVFGKLVLVWLGLVEKM